MTHEFQVEIHEAVWEEWSTSEGTVYHCLAIYSDGQACEDLAVIPGATTHRRIVMREALEGK